MATTIDDNAADEKSDIICVKQTLFGAEKTGGAWLSSARVVRCWVKSRNERNPYR